MSVSASNSLKVTVSTADLLEKLHANRKEHIAIYNESVDGFKKQCELCGYNEFKGALDFHHKNPEDKSFAIAKFDKYSYERIEAEIEKCMVVCSNCHRELHYLDRRRKQDLEEIEFLRTLTDKQKAVRQAAIKEFKAKYAEDKKSNAKEAEEKKD